MKVFLIDDDPISLFLTQTKILLINPNLTVQTFLSALQGLEALRALLEAEVPEIILLDLNMPEMDGWDFLEELKSIDSNFLRACQIYILTSSLDNYDEIISKDYSIVKGILHKPIKEEDIQFILAQKYTL